MLTPPEWGRGTQPVGKAALGLVESLTSEVVELQGNFKVEHLVKATAPWPRRKCPRYTEMLVATDAKLGWKLDTYNAWRYALSSRSIKARSASNGRPLSNNAFRVQRTSSTRPLLTSPSDISIEIITCDANPSFY